MRSSTPTTRRPSQPRPRSSMPNMPSPFFNVRHVLDTGEATGRAEHDHVHHRTECDRDQPMHAVPADPSASFDTASC